MLPVWERPRFAPGGGNAFVFFVAYGVFGQELGDGLEEYRTAGLPPGLRAQRLRREEMLTLPFTEGEMGRILRLDGRELIESMLAAPECLVIQGERPDPSDLNYLRDAVGVLAWWLDHGAEVILDVQGLKLYDAASWWLDLFAPLPPHWLNHVLILAADEEGGCWLHTRGLRKFGRPDLSIRNVTRELYPAVLEMLQRLTVFQVEGGLIHEEQSIEMAGLPGGLTCHHGGCLTDPSFNNVHVDVRWPRTFSY